MREMLVSHNRQVASGAAQTLSSQLAQRQSVLAALAREAASGDPDDILILPWLALLLTAGSRYTRMASR